MDAFPLSGWLILILPPILFIGSVVIWYIRELKMKNWKMNFLKNKKEMRRLNQWVVPVY